ncbi:MAG TPA: sigma-70 family RNA polymerase sigma factor [Cyclobacteriaceae bacterium]|nr:sigma-70 family RNA polymerase sigma factor [Cyclobacteriaceae bacterium]
MTDDRTLVSRILGGDMQAFRLLIQQNERLVLHMISKLVDAAEEREEICQDVFLKVYEKLGDFAFQSRLSTWIATIAYRHAVNHLRKRHIRFSEIPDERVFINSAVEHDNPESILEEKDIENYILNLVQQLPPQYKTILLLYHVEHKSYQEIESITGMPEGTVKNYLFRARKLLKDKVEKLQQT